ncbi:sensor histidine kinase [Geomonas subterranea]|uniref:sensor histidine kinase n=1 Tax=Geomonas subterranea TaxID=2847989 RepID=UPI001CD7B9C0|nr:ATP-binding protein [Geomonas fuzhouensis]
MSDADPLHILQELQLMTEANNNLEAFNAAIAHDLCSAITAISGYCQLLTEVCRNQLDEQGKAYLGCIYDATLDMKQLIASLLNFSHIGRVELRREKIDLSEMANVVTEQLRLSQPKRRVTFRIARGISVEGDPGLCRSVLDNLIGNAWKHGFHRGNTVIEFGMTLLAGQTTYFVRDNGPGFDMAVADRIFACFQRLPGTTVEGHGIGLATVDRIVRRHGGRVWAESRPGEGATFLFTMG